MKRVLVTGAAGQIGSELIPLLRDMYGPTNVVAVGHRTRPTEELVEAGPYETVDTRDAEGLKRLVQKYEANTIYHLASLLSATAEESPDLAWDINVNSLKHVLDLAREYKIQVFWPSSIGAFGPTTPSQNTPQSTILEPNTMYGITKVSGELLCNYYHKKFGVDVRSLRYPGIISYKTEPGGGTTDYAVSIFYEALKEKKYECYLRPDTVLPMIYMEDALKATIDLMSAPAEKLSTRMSYNLTAFSFKPEDLVHHIQRHIPTFTCTYKPDPVRQAIADSWPDTIDDSVAREEWGWEHSYTLERMTADMLQKLSAKLGLSY